MRIGVVTLFPELFGTFLRTSFVERAQSLGRVQVEFEHLRGHGHGVHQSVDDTPYGGGSGMVLRVDCVVAAIEALEARQGGRSHRVLLTPQGKPFRQSLAAQLATREHVTLICGRYEGFDERVRTFVDEEVSLGDFVLTGGEIPAMAVIEACIRLLPGVLGNASSTHEESFSLAEGTLLEYPQYTRPAEFRGMPVPDVLKSGDHAKIQRFRLTEAERRTRERRPDMIGRNRDS